MAVTAEPEAVASGSGVAPFVFSDEPAESEEGGDGISATDWPAGVTVGGWDGGVWKGAVVAGLARGGTATGGESSPPVCPSGPEAEEAERRG